MECIRPHPAALTVDLVATIRFSIYKDFIRSFPVEVEVTAHPAGMVGTTAVIVTWQMLLDDPLIL